MTRLVGQLLETVIYNVVQEKLRPIFLTTPDRLEVLRVPT